MTRQDGKWCEFGEFSEFGEWGEIGGGGVMLNEEVPHYCRGPRMSGPAVG